MNSKLNAEFKAILELDLDPIKAKLMHKESGEGWSLQQTSAVEFEYRRFLYLMKVFPHEQTAPLVDVDIFWHYHILDTMKYAADCQHIFGYFLHHFPYVGMRGGEDEVTHHRVGVRMQELYEATFGQAYIRQDEGAAARGITAWSSQAQNDRLYAASPAPGAADTAWCSQIESANDSSYAVRPALGTPITAWCSQIQSANDSAYTVRPASVAAKTAWCSQVQSAGDRPGSMRPAMGTPITAWCSQAPSANGSSYSLRPALLVAA